MMDLEAFCLVVTSIMEKSISSNISKSLPKCARNGDLGTWAKLVEVGREGCERKT